MSATTATTTCRTTILLAIADLEDEMDCAMDAADAASADGDLHEAHTLVRDIIRMRTMIRAYQAQLADYPA